VKVWRDGARFFEDATAFDARSDRQVLACGIGGSAYIRKISRAGRRPGSNKIGINLWAKGAGAPYAAAKGTLKDGEWTGLLFETMAEDKLVQPTILYDFPTDISPLSKQKPEDPSLTSDLKYTSPEWKWPTAFPN